MNHKHHRPTPLTSKFPFKTPMMVLTVMVMTVFSSVVFLAANAQTVSTYRDFSFGPSVSSPTGQKPQSKLWFADGKWWGSLFNVASDNHEIYRLDAATQKWTATGTLIDERNGASPDMLWDGSHLYAVSAGTSASDAAHSAKIMRYSYDAATGTYTLDAGFPVMLKTAGGMETAVLAKATDGTLWTTYTKNKKVYAAHSTVSESTWTAPYLINTPGSTNLSSDDIASIVSFGNSVGIMWSNQTDQKMYFAAHTNGAADTQWAVTAAVSGSRMADDHINLKSDALGQVYAVTKTSRADVSSLSSEPVIILSVRSTAGVWKNYTVAKKGEGTVTRGTLAIDEVSRTVRVFYTNNESGGAILMKQSPLDAIAFSTAKGSSFLSTSTDTRLNNATTSKQSITPASGLVVMAADDTTNYYAHSYLPTAAATVNPSASTTPTPSATAIPAAAATPSATPPPAGISLRSPAVTASNGSGASSVSINGPIGAQAGDVALAQVAVRGATTVITPPAGWALIRRTNTASAMSSLLYYKVITATEPSTYTFVFNSSQQAVVGLSAYSGVNTASPIDVHSGRYNESVSAMTANSVTTTTPKSHLLWFGSVTVYNSAITVPAGMTARYAAHNNAATGISIGMADLSLVTSGITGNKVGSNSLAKSNLCQLVALRPAS